jgi:hypothetical protein
LEGALAKEKGESNGFPIYTSRFEREPKGIRDEFQGRRLRGKFEK